MLWKFVSDFVDIAIAKANDEGSKCVTRSQMDSFGK
jgi:hypothetical protein